MAFPRLYREAIGAMAAYVFAEKLQGSYPFPLILLGSCLGFFFPAQAAPSIRTNPLVYLNYCLEVTQACPYGVYSGVIRELAGGETKRLFGSYRGL